MASANMWNNSMLVERSYDILKATTLQIKPNETSKNGDFTLTPVKCLELQMLLYFKLMRFL